MDGSNFNVRRIILYGNGFLPVIVGRVEARGDGESQLIGVMRLSYPTAIFMAVWFAGVIIGCLTITISTLGTPPVTWVDFIPEIMLVAGAALTLGAFLPEAASALRALKKVAAEADRAGLVEHHA